MGLEGWQVERVERRVIRAFIERWHYSGGINGVKGRHYFALRNPCGELCGAALWGHTATTSWQQFPVQEAKVLELRRLCCIDDTPRNAETFLIGACIRWLRTHTVVEWLVSYADPEHGHEGVIYRASNWNYEGKTPAGTMIRWGDQLYHDRSLRVRYKGNLKPFATELKNALANGKAERIEVEGKHRYTYHLPMTRRRAAQGVLL